MYRKMVHVIVGQLTEFSQITYIYTTNIQIKKYNIIRMTETTVLLHFKHWPPKSSVISISYSINLAASCTLYKRDI